MLNLPLDENLTYQNLIYWLKTMVNLLRLHVNVFFAMSKHDALQNFINSDGSFLLN